MFGSFGRIIGTKENQGNFNLLRSPRGRCASNGADLPAKCLEPVVLAQATKLHKEFLSDPAGLEGARQNAQVQGFTVQGMGEPPIGLQVASPTVRGKSSKVSWCHDPLTHMPCDTVWISGCFWSFSLEK